jgi:hypothetical protein
MHIHLRLCSPRLRAIRPLWFYRWGFWVWLCGILLSAGHDTRGGILSTEELSEP